ncbi:hypothetical protein GGI42DRAFT_53346 [Trichoderma sp. SZMC 28013]
MIAKRIRTPLLPMMAGSVNVPPALTLAAHPSPIEILQPARPRAAGRRDEAVPPRARVLACGLGRRKDGGGRTRRVLVGGRVDGGGRAIRVSGDEAGRVRAGVLVVVVDERVLAHAVTFFFSLPWFMCVLFLASRLAQRISGSEKEGSRDQLRRLSPTMARESWLHKEYGGGLGRMPIFCSANPDGPFSRR